MAEHTKALRRRLNLTPAAFAARYRLPLDPVRDWEKEQRQPDAPALALLRLIAHDPEGAAWALVLT